MDRWQISVGGEKQISGRSVNMNRSELPHSHTNDDEEQLCVLCSLSAAWLDFSESVWKKCCILKRALETDDKYEK